MVLVRGVYLLPGLLVLFGGLFLYFIVLWFILPIIFIPAGLYVALFGQTYRESVEIVSAT